MRTLLLLITSTAMLFSFISVEKNAAPTETVQKSIPIAQYYEGGEEALIADIQKELVYPMMAKRARKQGTCVIKVKLNADGTTSDFQIVSELGYGTGQEALRVVKTLQFKSPGFDQNHNIPVNFSLK